MTRKRWLSKPPTHCNLCGESLESSRFFVDGRTMLHPTGWCHMCPVCFRSVGMGLGIGYGQAYENKPPYYKLDSLGTETEEII